MISKDSQPLEPPRERGQICPICGKRSYSLKGIHPQCAVQQADAPRQKALAAAKKRKQARLQKAAAKR